MPGGDEGYVSSIPEATNGDDNYWTRTDGTGLDVSFSNQVGFYFAGQDTDDAGVGGPIPVDSTPVTLDWTGIDIAGYTDLSFSGFFAEDDASDGEEDWDRPSAIVRVSVQIDGGGFTDIVGFATEVNPADPDDISNLMPRQDLDFDGVGEGAPLTSTFTQYQSSIAGTGSLLDIRLTVIGMGAADEDFAVDTFTVTGAAVPEPTSVALAAVASLALFGAARRRK